MMEIINRQNSDKTQGKKYKLKTNTQQYFACFSIFDAVADDDSALFVLLLLFILWRSFFVVILSVLQLFYTKKKINYIFEFLIDFKWYPNILMFFYAFFPIFAGIFYSVVLFFYSLLSCNAHHSSSFDDKSKHWW